MHIIDVLENHMTAAGFGADGFCDVSIQRQANGIWHVIDSNETEPLLKVQKAMDLPTALKIVGCCFGENTMKWEDALANSYAVGEMTPEQWDEWKAHVSEPKRSQAEAFRKASFDEP